MHIIVVLCILIFLGKRIDGTFTRINDGMFENSDDHHTFSHCGGDNVYLKYYSLGLIWSQVEQRCIWNMVVPMVTVTASSSAAEATSNSSFDPNMVCDVTDWSAGFLVNKATGRVLDSNKEQNVYTLKWNGGTYQQWKFLRQADGSYVLQNLATSLVLDSNGYQTYTHDLNGGRYQKWILYWNQDNYYVLLNLATSRVLDCNFEDLVYPSVGNGADSQKWFFERA